MASAPFPPSPLTRSLINRRNRATVEIFLMKFFAPPMHYYFFIGISTVDIKIFLGQWFEQEIEIMKYEIREMFPVVCIDYSVGSDRQFVATIECSD